MGLTPERAKQIMFTAPYADTNLAVYGPKSTAVKSAAELGSLRVVAAKGTTQDLGLAEMNPQAMQPQPQPTLRAKPIFSRQTA